MTPVRLGAAATGVWTMVVVLGLASCAAPPPPPPAPLASSAYLVLLADDDGKAGEVRFATAQGETVLNRAMQATRLTAAAGTTFEASPAQLARDFGPVLAALPKPAQTFLLYFQAGGARLTPESEAAVAQVLQAVRDRPVPDMSVVGHTDTAGDDETNVRLGLERAQFVARLLAGAQLDATRVQVLSHGEKNLLVATPDNTPEPRNRRVEVTIR